MQAIDGDEFFGEVEWRSEVIHAAIDVVWIGDVIAIHVAAGAEDAGTGREYGIPGGGFRGIGRLAEVIYDDLA